MSAIDVFQLPVLSDNYNFVIRCLNSGKVACVDPSEFEPIDHFLSSRKWPLDYILNTHHHWDHIGGNEALKKKYGCRIFGSEQDRNRIPGIDETLAEGDEILIGDSQAKVMFLPGHTLGHIAYWFKDDNCAFVGDYLKGAPNKCLIA